MFEKDFINPLSGLLDESPMINISVNQNNQNARYVRRYPKRFVKFVNREKTPP